VVSNIAVPLTSEYSVQAANENAIGTLTDALEAFSKSALGGAANASFSSIPITSLSDTAQIQELSSAPQAIDALIPLASAQVLVLPAQQNIVDVSALPSVNAPVVITALTESTLTITDSANTNVNIVNLDAPQAKVESFINTGVGTLTVATAGTNLSSLSLTGKVAFTASADTVTTGITVSGQSDSSNVNLYLVGGASASQGSTDAITLGNGNDLVVDSGNGQVVLNLGTGNNMVLLAGIGVSGSVNFATHSDSVVDIVGIAANSVSAPTDLSATSLVTLSGLNNDANSSDAITFLGDMGATLTWAGSTGSASGAQITSVSGDSTNLANWIAAAQNADKAAHSVAWFQFNGNTYVLESAGGAQVNHVGDTLVKLTGLTQFTGSNGELAFGMLHLAG
jgi:S-layer protein